MQYSTEGTSTSNDIAFFSIHALGHDLMVTYWATNSKKIFVMRRTNKESIKQLQNRTHEHELSNRTNDKRYLRCILILLSIQTFDLPAGPEIMAVSNEDVLAELLSSYSSLNRIPCDIHRFLSFPVVTPASHIQ